MADLALTIGATTDNNQTWAGTASDALSAIKLTINNEDTAGDTNTGIVATKITNQKGSSLPSTGGIGTTMFYVGGGVLVAGAGVLLITKKRAMARVCTLEFHQSLMVGYSITESPTSKIKIKKMVEITPVFFFLMRHSLMPADRHTPAGRL